MLRLTDLSSEFANGAEDVRGYGVVDPKGQNVGRVEAVFVDPYQRKVRFLELGAGEAVRVLLVPVDAIAEVAGGRIRITQPKERVLGSPEYNPGVGQAQGYWEALYRHYGYLPHWSTGNVFPGYPSDSG